MDFRIIFKYFVENPKVAITARRFASINFVFAALSLPLKGIQQKQTLF